MAQADGLRLEAGTRAALTTWCAARAGQAVVVTVAPHAATRSTQANAYYWGGVVAPACETTGQEPEDFHDEMCARFLTRRRIAVVDDTTGEAEQVAIAGRSSRLRVGDFYRFVEQVRVFVAEFLQVETPDPDPAYWRTTQQEQEQVHGD